MTWAVPDWWTVALLALATIRSFQLLANDTILDRPREWIVGRLGDKFDAWLLCAWCAGAWLTVAWWLAWVARPHWTLVVATPFAISALVGLVGARLLD